MHYPKRRVSGVAFGKQYSFISSRDLGATLDYYLMLCSVILQVRLDTGVHLNALDLEAMGMVDAGLQGQDQSS